MGVWGPGLVVGALGDHIYFFTLEWVSYSAPIYTYATRVKWMSTLRSCIGPKLRQRRTPGWIERINRCSAIPPST